MFSRVLNFHNIYFTVVIGVLIFVAGLIYKKWTNSLQYRSLAFTLDTLYLNWNTSFPAITVCEMANGEKNWDLSEKYYGSERNAKLDDYLLEVSFFAGSCSSCGFCGNKLDCPEDYNDIISKFRSTCSEMLSSCTWNGNPFVCCDHMLPVQTEYGTCFSINSIHTNPPYGGFRLIANRINGPGKLKFEANEDIAIHIHDVNDVPYLAEGQLRENVLLGSNKELMISIVEIVNDPDVRTIDIENRHCLFPRESNSQYDQANSIKHYSVSNCIIGCIVDAHYAICNCTHHLMPRIKQYVNICDNHGMACLSQNIVNITQKRRQCECLPSCEEPEYTIIFSSDDNPNEEDNTVVSISMIDLPKHRYIRKTVKTNMDYMISIGGLMGLFFNLSIMNLLGFITKVIKHVWKYVMNHIL